MREQRRQDLDLHVREYNAELRKQNLDLDHDDAEGREVLEGIATDDGISAEDKADTRKEEDEYVDEEKYTTVTVAPMTFSDNDDEEDTPSTIGRKMGNDVAAPEEKPPRPEYTREKKKKKKKKTFRYESKAERQVTRQEQKRKSRAARARREKEGDRGR